MKQTYTIVRAWTMASNGLDKQAGWDILCNGEWCNRYWLLRDAKHALALEGIKATVVR